MPMSTEEARSLAGVVYKKYPEVVVLLREYAKAVETLDYRRCVWLSFLLSLAGIPHNFHPNHLRLMYRLVRGSHEERKAILDGVLAAATEYVVAPALDH